MSKFKVISDYFSKHWFDFVWIMTFKEIKARYKRVFFGFLWAILNPILQMLVIGFIFRFLIPVKIDNYFYFLLAGLLPWNFFSSTFTKSIQLMLGERSLIQKAKFPREALVLSVVFSNLFHFLISLVIFTVLAVFISSLSLWKLIILFLVLAWLVIFTIGLSLLLSTLFVKYRDIKFIMQAVTPLWFYATPVVYTRSLLPVWISNLLLLNPMTGIIELFQFVFSNSSTITANPTDYLVGFLLSLVIITLGVLIFIKDNQYFDDWL